MAYNCDIISNIHTENVVGRCLICGSPYCNACGHIDLKVHQFHVSPEDLAKLEEGIISFETFINSKRMK